MSVIHSGGWRPEMVSPCGKGFSNNRSCDWNNVTCVDCLMVDAPYSIRAAERLAELDRAQAQTIKQEPKRFLDGISMTMPVMLPSENVTIHIGLSANDITQRTVDVSLLTRLSDFIASIPGNALDRKSNAVAMTLRREIANVVCPSDKVRG